jgi:hypothetical protein
VSSSYATTASYALNALPTYLIATGSVTASVNVGTDTFLVKSGVTTLANIKSNGNTLIGTTSDGGFKLDVNGTIRSQGKLTVSTGGATIIGDTGITGSLNVTGSGTAGSFNVNDVFIISGSLIGNKSATNAPLQFMQGASAGRPVMTLTSSVSYGGRLTINNYGGGNNSGIYLDAGITNNIAVLGFESGTSINAEGDMIAKSNAPWRLYGNTNGIGGDSVTFIRNGASGFGSIFSARLSGSAVSPGVYANGLDYSWLSTGYQLTVTGSALFSDIIALPFQSPLPSSKPTGSIALSGSGGTFNGMYVYNGTSWVNVKA